MTPQRRRATTHETVAMKALTGQLLSEIRRATESRARRVVVAARRDHPHLSETAHHTALQPGARLELPVAHLRAQTGFCPHFGDDV